MNETCFKCKAQCCKFVIAVAPDADNLEMLKGRAAFFAGSRAYIAARCKYLDSSDRCSIYPIRPHLCQAFEVGCQACQEVRDGSKETPA
jgi:Fe-S-cluster containining protein